MNCLQNRRNMIFLLNIFGLVYVLTIVLGLNFQNNTWNTERKHISRIRFAEEYRITDYEKEQFIILHNKYRQNLTPPAADMQFMEWNDDLARIAQDWADKCIWDHGNLRDPKFEGGMGQNLYMGYSRSPLVHMNLWFKEYQYYDYYSNYCQSGKECGHYLQLVWANSRMFGCGLKVGCRYRNRYYIACNYYPAGNVKGRHPYKIGVPCSKCSNSSDGGLCSEGLCVTREQCKKYNLDECVCNLKCHNCGIFKRESCKCECKDGWDQLDCSSFFISRYLHLM
ncbi:peptidase inhibitor 15-like [Centruroides sculpturatus]|uniref:peptidase inhibitor 15-like n=1 Tax=Centruroides sculpturatus TaxID=218467 RepID=UPI000C6D9946|nr:peptidase inhibitor 15-like [Centruroides sculpturatus]